MGVFEGVLSCLLMDEVGPIPLWVVLFMGRRSWLDKKADEHEPGSTPAGSLPPRFLPLLLLELLPALTSISDGVHMGHVSQINPFLAKCFLWDSNRM